MNILKLLHRHTVPSLREVHTCTLLRIISTATARTLLIILAALHSQLAAAEPIAVIVNSANSEPIDSDTIKLIYSDKKSFWENGEKIQLFELPVKSDVREKFSRTLLHKSSISSQADWSNRYINNTIKNDVKIKPQKLVVKFISLQDSAIGYIPLSMSENIDNIKIVMTID